MAKFTNLVTFYSTVSTYLWFDPCMLHCPAHHATFDFVIPNNTGKKYKFCNFLQYSFPHPRVCVCVCVCVCVWMSRCFSEDHFPDRQTDRQFPCCWQHRVMYLWCLWSHSSAALPTSIDLQPCDCICLCLVRRRACSMNQGVWRKCQVDLIWGNCSRMDRSLVIMKNQSPLHHCSSVVRETLLGGGGTTFFFFLKGYPGTSF